MFWSLLLCVLALLLYFLGSIEPWLCLVCAALGLLYFIYEFWQVIKLARTGDSLKSDLHLSYLKPFAHVSGLDLLQGQNCFLAIAEDQQLVIVAENYQENLPIQALDRILELRKKDVKPFVHHVERLVDQVPEMTNIRAYHLLNALQPAVVQSWNGLMILEIDEEWGTRMIVLRPLWGTRSWDILDQPAIKSLLTSPDENLAGLAAEIKQRKIEKSADQDESAQNSTDPKSGQARHTLKKADLAKPVHVDKEDYYES